MDGYAVRVRGLTKRYGDVHALAGLDLDVPAGSICGFLGSNGAGKTTTIRTLLGLIRADSGDVRVLGVPVPAGLVRLRGRIGAIVDRPALYPPLSGRRNLLIVADTIGTMPGRDGRPHDRIDTVLELVGMTAAASRPVRGYSAGMRQRLALAGALLAEPELLLLDEPATGLDPAGQRELRRVLADVRDAGATLLISSHQLAEVEQVCDHVAIVDAGRLLAAGATADLLGRASAWRVDVGEDGALAAEALTAAGFPVERAGGAAAGAHLVVTADDPRWISYTLAMAGIWLARLEPHRFGLADVFFRLTGGDAGGVDQDAGRAP